MLSRRLLLHAPRLLTAQHMCQQSRPIFSQLKELYNDYKEVERLTSEETYNELVEKRQREEQKLEEVVCIVRTTADWLIFF